MIVHQEREQKNEIHINKKKITHTKTIVKDSPLMGKNLIHIKLVLLQTLAVQCIRLQRKSLH